MSLVDTFAPKALVFQSPARGLFNALQQALGATWNQAARIVAFYENRRSFARVAELNYAELRDIGLTPGDVTFARHLPMHVDPSRALAEMVEERRTHTAGGLGKSKPTVH